MKMLNFQALGGAIAFGQSGPGQGKREVMQCREVPERLSNAETTVIHRQGPMAPAIRRDLRMVLDPYRAKAAR